MKVKKKGMLATGMVVAASILALAGCSSSGTTATPTDDGTAASGTLTVWVDADRARVGDVCGGDARRAPGAARSNGAHLRSPSAESRAWPSRSP